MPARHNGQEVGLSDHPDGLLFSVRNDNRMPVAIAESGHKVESGILRGTSKRIYHGIHDAFRRPPKLPETDHAPQTPGCVNDRQRPNSVLQHKLAGKSNGGARLDGDGAV